MDMVAWRRGRRVLARVARAAWRLEQAERERAWALASAKAEGVSVRQIAQAAGLSPSRVHQVVTGADVDALGGALGALRRTGWPAPEDPDIEDDGELSGRADVAGHLEDKVPSIPQCAGLRRVQRRTVRAGRDRPRRVGGVQPGPRRPEPFRKLDTLAVLIAEALPNTGNRAN
jgi:hypothetical protein